MGGGGMQDKIERARELFRILEEGRRNYAAEIALRNFRIQELLATQELSA